MSFRVTDERQDFAPEDDHLFELRPARDDELRDADALVLKKDLRELLRRPHEGHRRRPVIGDEPGPQVAVQPADVVRGGQGLLIRLRITPGEDGALLFAYLLARQQGLRGRERRLPRRPANYAQPETDFDPAFPEMGDQRAQLLGRVNQTQPARTLC